MNIFKMKMLSYFRNAVILIVTSLLAVACANDIVDINGSIRGVVKDSNNSSLLANCQVSLSPGGKSVFTGTDGLFEFTSLEPGAYTLTITRAGYEDATKSVKVVSGETCEANIALKAKSAFALSDSKLNFGDLSTSMALTLFNNSDESCSFTISNMPSWASISHASGVISAGSSMVVSVLVDRSAVDYGTYSQIVNIAYKGKVQGTTVLTLQMEKVQLSAPKINIAVAAESITQNSFIIDGELTATGGAEVTSYGHCWGVSPNPTVDDHKTDLGTTTSIGTFKSTVSELTPGTSYYVRAYATNQYGTAYSNQIVVTTQDVASNKWDGNIATKFARGSGTNIDPYIIETGGQLLLMKDYNDKCFEIANNIDLDNKSWLPFEFKGTLDGKGCIISNLKVNRSTEKQGLFSVLSGTVKNLTFKNVNIVAPSLSYIGTLAGALNHYAVIRNCQVILTESSQITGNQFVGGLAGGCSDFKDEVSITESSVEYSGISLDVIKGNKDVGGIIGYLALCRANRTDQYATDNIISCKVQANIKGSENIGGMVGRTNQINSERGEIKQCSFKGKVEGVNSVGGIIGRSDYCCVVASKSDVELTISGAYGGGIIGSLMNSYNQDKRYIIACYSFGSISGSSSNKSIGGLLGGQSSYTYGYESDIRMSYSTVKSTLSNFDGIAGIGNTSYSANGQESSSYCASIAPTRFTGNNQGGCQDITTFLKECYQSEYDQYWNYNKTWTWSGIINNNNTVVSCPLLSWE